MKKTIMIILSLVLFFSFSIQSKAKLKDNLTKNYSVMISPPLNGKYVNYYSKPNGTVMGKVAASTTFMKGNQYNGYQYNSVKVLKAVNSKWLKVKIEKNSYKYSKKNKGADKYNRIFYIKMSNILVTLEGGEVFHFVAKGNPTLLKAKKNSKSKTIAEIPLGTFFSSEYVIGTGNGAIAYPKNQKWVHVKYVKKGKVYTGYVNTKDIQVYNLE